MQLTNNAWIKSGSLTPFRLAKRTLAFFKATDDYVDLPESQWRYRIWFDNQRDLVLHDRARAMCGIPRACIEEDPFPHEGKNP